MPGGGVNEEADLVRANVRDVLRALKVDSGEDGDRGYKQGFVSPVTVYKRRTALGQLFRAAFLALWRRAIGLLAATSRPKLHDDDSGCSDAAMPLM